VFKVRKPLPYRLAELDDAIRRQRTIREAESIAGARGAGVETPRVLLVDLARATLILEFVPGIRLKDLLLRTGGSEAASLFHRLGADIAKLHSAGIVHGDLTTANIIVSEKGLVFLDFGLSQRSTRVEDFAVDLRLIKETLVGAHPMVAEAAFAGLRSGYGELVGKARSRRVFTQLSNVERRGRYARVV